MNELLDDELLQAYADTNYGYGNYQGSYWFVGMEQGGGGSFKDIAKRLRVWKQLGQNELDDLCQYHVDLGVQWLFGEHAKLQPTWNKLIRVVLNAEQQEITVEQVRSYQRDSLGRKDSNNCLLELLPLPSPSIQDWMYAKYSALPQLATRTSYISHYVERRIEHIQQRISEHTPKAVVFYGIQYKDWWKKIADVPFVEVSTDGLLIGKNETTTFVITKHPSTKGVPNEYFHQVGRQITANER